MPKSIYRDEYRILIDLLRDARERAGITQGAVASKFGWPQSTLSHLERGSRRIDVVEFIDYCLFVEANPQEMFDHFLKLSGKTVAKGSRKA